MFSLVRKFFPSFNEKNINSMKKIAKEVIEFQQNLEQSLDQDLRKKTDEFRNKLVDGKTLDDLLVEAFAVVREMSKRVLNMEHFEEQIIGGVVLHRGMISEMKTGEGKTLVATLAAYLNALPQKGVHIVTVNDYLAKRDSEWMRPLYEALGLTVGCITNDLNDQERKNAYACDITYGTNNEFGFDYLRDNMKFELREMVHRPFNYAIVDEVDSILIDEARTPLIISGPIKQDVTVYNKIDKLIPLLSEEDFVIEEKNRSVVLTDEGSTKVEELLKKHALLAGNTSLYDIDNISLLHHVDQAIKAHKLFSRDKDYIIKDGKIIIIDEFTGRMMDGRRYSDGLHQALEAKEGVKIQQENQTLASITFQNYFRLYPKLSGMTGTAATEAEELGTIYRLNIIQVPTHLPIQRTDHDDEIYSTFDEKCEAIIRQIKKCNEVQQPVLVGTVSIEKSEIFSKKLKKHKLKHAVLNARYHEQEAQIIAQAGRPGAITIATNMAGRGTDIKLGGADCTETEKQQVIEAGGLYIIGTERHESRRIDNQLRGRAGRQGDPGQSKFFLSLEDDLLRIFGSDNIKGILQRLGLKDGESVYHPMISRAIEKAQSKVEARNYEIRKTLLRFDDVSNSQRQVIFDRRYKLMNVSDYDLSDMRKEVNNDIIASSASSDGIDIEHIINESKRVYGLDMDINDNLDQDEIADILEEATDSLFKKKAEMYYDQITAIKKQIMLVTLDNLWKDHLLMLDHLRQGIGLRAIGQKNPINEFKKEAFIAFEAMLHHWQELVISRFARFVITVDYSYMQISRNQPCPCGSGEKYKHCHGSVSG